ncbi:S49 family peptidase [Salmonella enterica]|nr:S49 family peptidase [Salmonella enterica subsp. enterica serovar Muenchen]EDP9280298.1 S49 family peptidase [Salmonella enterica subsp. enterica serovar Pomona]EEH6573821.1 S49 family peptidase [Salmonella enterica]ECZ7902271.1 S49 family peptidase [Salmonella enterica subsp. enterica serovar Muenchen]EEK7224456.1 S49 family peptidase [Salmonella enterica subsp. enterica serovar Muenchen]
MQRNLPHIISQATSAPLLLEPAYARVFFCALGRESGINSLHIPGNNESLDQSDMALVTGDFMATGKPQARFYQVVNGIAVLPVTGALVHKLGGMRPFSGMTGYDGITARLQQAVSDPEVKGILLDIDSPGGQAAGAFDCADMISRMREQKPVWALANETACSAAMLLAAACSHRLVTQTSRMGSIGVVMAHTSYAEKLKQEGIDITLIYSGAHKADLMPSQKLPESVYADYQQRMDEARKMFAEKVARYTGLSVDAVMATEAAVYDGQAIITTGLADGMVNAADAIGVMAEAINSNKTGGTMSELTATEAAAQENQRVMGIIGCQEAKGREALAQMLAGQPGMSVTQAQAILSAAAPQQEAVSEADRIMALDDARGREELASTLAAMPDMTAERAKTILAAAPRVGATSLSDSILALDEAKGREELAKKLAAVPGMTTEQARELLVAAPDASGSGGASMNNAFDQFMQLHSPASLSGGDGNSSDVDTDTQLLMSIPGTMAAKGEDKS